MPYFRLEDIGTVERLNALHDALVDQGYAAGIRYPYGDLYDNGAWVYLKTTRHGMERCGAEYVDSRKHPDNPDDYLPAAARPDHHPAAPTAVDFMKALEDSEHPYHALAHALLGAYEQAAIGKGKERHANDLTFDKQHMQTLADGQGHVGGMIYQVCKKAQESERMDADRRRSELHGAMVYAAGAIVWDDRHREEKAAQEY